MKKSLLTLCLALASLGAHAAELLTEAAWGVDFGPWIATWQGNNSVASAQARTVSKAALDGTSISFYIAGPGYLTFTGSKVAGSATRSDVWTGTSGAYTLRLWRDFNGEGVSGEVRTGTAKYRVAQVVRYNSAGHGLLILMKSEDAQMKMVDETFPS